MQTPRSGKEQMKPVLPLFGAAAFAASATLALVVAAERFSAWLHRKII